MGEPTNEKKRRLAIAASFPGSLFFPPWETLETRLCLKVVYLTVKQSRESSDLFSLLI